MVLLAAVALLALLFAVLQNRREAAPEGPEPAPAAEPPAPQRQPDSPPPAPPTAEPAEPPAAAEVPPGHGARVALVIDDLGRSLADLDLLARLEVPLSYSVLPFEARSREVAAEVVRRRGEVLCHLPMEGGDAADPGPGALTRRMAPGELAAATRRALDAVPGAVGVNNHMGSLLSADAGAMAAVLGVLAERGLFFLDSRTSAESVGYATARRLGVATAERQVFLDPDPSPYAIAAQFDRLLEVARERGAAIAIGHPYPETFGVLAELVPRAQAAGYEFVPVSYLLDDAGAPPL